ncbi:unnamed protein product [Timema podura]|uniref:Uncharacterized protein n=1 Tax=Timema podura TaxID=61482 RepID=A0ABN7PF22_TIMPD|nr:unnamed protein product [Timema podura]
MGDDRLPETHIRTLPAISDQSQFPGYCWSVLFFMTSSIVLPSSCNVHPEGSWPSTSLYRLTRSDLTGFIQTTKVCNPAIITSSAKAIRWFLDALHYFNYDGGEQKREQRAALLNSTYGLDPGLGPSLKWHTAGTSLIQQPDLLSCHTVVRSLVDLLALKPYCFSSSSGYKMSRSRRECSACVTEGLFPCSWCIFADSLAPICRHLVRGIEIFLQDLSDITVLPDQIPITIFEYLYDAHWFPLSALNLLFLSSLGCSYLHCCQLPPVHHHIYEPLIDIATNNPTMFLISLLLLCHCSFSSALFFLPFRFTQLSSSGLVLVAQPLATQSKNVDGISPGDWLDCATFKSGLPRIVMVVAVVLPVLLALWLWLTPGRQFTLEDMEALTEFKDPFDCPPPKYTPLMMEKV